MTAADTDPVATAAQHEQELAALELTEHPTVRAAYRDVAEKWLSRAKPSEAMRERFDDAFREVMFSAAVWSSNQDKLRPKVSCITRLGHPIGEQEIPGSRWGIDNPDSVYRVIPISGDERYVISGRVGANRMTENYFTLWDANMGTVAVLNGRTMEVEPDGSYTITVDSDPAGGRPNHVQSTPEAHEFYIRDVLLDWGRDDPNHIAVERLGAPPASAARTRDEQADATAQKLDYLFAQVDTELGADKADPLTTFIASITILLREGVEALLIVTVVIFLFLGSLRAVLVPVIAMPLSLVGTFFVMLLLGYSINLLTLLALVLAIGLVVDDAIIVVENVDRHMREGKTPLQSALIAARELGSPILAMTVVLVAVYVPIGFQGGLTGALFTEFAFTLAGAVTVSGLVALTLSPMMCSRVFKPEQDSGRFATFIEHTFERVHRGYARLLSSLLTTWPVLIVMGVILIACLGLMFKMSKYELAPEEDQGIVLAMLQGPATANIDQMQLYADQVFREARALPEYDQMFQLTGQPAPNTGIGGVLLKPWDQRTRSAHEVQTELQQRWARIAGARVAAFQFPPLPGSSGLPVQFVIKTTEPFQNLNTLAQKLMEKAQADGKFYYIDADLKYDLPQATLEIDRDKAAALGMTQQDVGNALTAALGGGYVNYFSIAGRSYKVMPQVQQVDRLNPSDVLDFYIKTPNGLVPASTVASLKHSVEPETINHFQQLNSVTLSGVPSGAQGDTLEYLREQVAQLAPGGYQIDYAGPSRQFVQESGGFALTFAFALIVVFLALAALFESFRDPVVILVSVPMALFGAMIFVFLGFASMNIYTEVGLVTLMGLISKHGILIVEVANSLQQEGKSKLDAIVQAAGVRLRPILMTTAAMVFGVVPLVIASGAGAAGRQAMGIVIVTGMAIGTLFTLFVVPAMYLFLATDRSRKARVDDSPAPVAPQGTPDAA